MQKPTESSPKPARLVLPPSLWSRVVWKTIRLLLLAITVIVLWLSIEKRWGSHFSLPAHYTGDALYVLGMMRLSEQGDLGLFTHIYTNSLGAPFTGQLNDFPQTERVIIWLGGQIARLVGLMPAANIMLIVSCIVAAFSFYLAARLWKVSRLTAWGFAIAYAFLPHTQRSLSGLGIIFTGLLPLQFYVLWYLSTAQKLSWESWRFRLTLVISLLSGMLNIYWIFLFLQLYALALLCRVLKRRENSIKAAIPLAVTCLVAGAFLGSFIIYKINYGENPAALVRSYYDIERWALKPIELFLPSSGTGFPILSSYLSRYYDGGRMGIGENWWGNYIGILSIMGLFLLFFIGIQRQLNKRAPSLPCLAALWIIAYSSLGGVHSIFSLIFDFYNIRCTNRYSVAIGTIGFLYLVFSIHKGTQQWSSLSKYFLSITLPLLAVADQSHRSYIHHRISYPPEKIEKAIMMDKALALKLEKSVEANSMIYILPAVDFPEPFTGRGSVDLGLLYHMIRPSLYSTQLRYSYGSHKGREGADWQLDVQELPARGMARVLESYGFAGILLNRRGYEDRGGQLLEELAQAGWPMEFEQGVNNEWVFIRLAPAKKPVLPTLTPYAVTSQN